MAQPGQSGVRPDAARLATGAFTDDLDPASKDGWVEGNSAQYSWFVPHDPAGLFQSMGGRNQAIARLDQFFTHLNAGQGSPFAYFGNEPTMLTPWLYNWLGLPNRAQRVVRDVLVDHYKATPTGLPGNDDGGTTSAWYVLSALGFYPAVPGTDLLVTGSPLFPEATLILAGGTLKLTAPKAGRSHPYVKGLTISGRRQSAPWFRFRDLINGGKLAWDLSDKETAWGGAPEDVPPSFDG